MPSVSESLVVRDGTAADIPTLVEFNIALSVDSNDKTLDPATLERGLRRAFQTPALCRYFIAERGGRPIGCTMLTYELTDWRDGIVWWIQSVYVRPEERGKGVFDAIFEHIAALARSDESARSLRLYVLDDNTRAIKVYKRLGMEQSRYHVLEYDL